MLTDLQGHMRMQESAGHVLGNADRAFTAQAEGFLIAKSQLLHSDDGGEQSMASELDRVSFAQLRALLSNKCMGTKHRQYLSFFHMVQSRDHDLISAVPATSNGQAQVSSFTRQADARNSGLPALFVRKLSQRVCHVADGVTWSGTPSEPAQVHACYWAEGRPDSCTSGHHLIPALLMSSFS